MSQRGPIFHIGCVTLIIAAVLGYPLGSSVAQSMWGYNSGPLGGVVGFTLMMLIVGYFNRRRQIARDGRPGLMPRRLSCPPCRAARMRGPSRRTKRPIRRRRTQSPRRPPTTAAMTASSRPRKKGEEAGTQSLVMPVSPSDAQALRRAMLEVVTSGTGHGLAIDGFEIGAKTGTAQVDAARPDDTHGWIIGFGGLPGQDPTGRGRSDRRIGAGSGATDRRRDAAPIARQVLQAALCAG